MGHGITDTDQVVLHKERAWHNLGIVLPDALTPVEAAKVAMPWHAEQWPLVASNGTDCIILDNQVANVRSDSKQVLGVVSQDWKPMQPIDLAEICELLAKQSDIVKVESAGSIFGGKKIWFLLKGESFSVRSRDFIEPYICASTGFDGMTATRFTPTTVRVVCKNTLSMVVPMNDAADRGGSVKVNQACYVARHMGDMKQKVAEIQAALGLYCERLEDNREMITHLAAREMNNEQVHRFLLECYTRHFGAIPGNPQCEADQKVYDKAMESLTKMIIRFEKESPVGGSTAWNAMNAYTGWLQHDRYKRDGQWNDRQISANLFGVNAERSSEAMAMALSM